MQECIFCQIVEGKTPSRRVYEDEKVLAILDINPANPGHILLMPKQHVTIFPQLTEDLIAHLALVSKLLSKTLLRALKVEGTNIFIANGFVAGQRAPHVLIHIIPRKMGDGAFPEIAELKLSKEKIQELKEKIK